MQLVFFHQHSCKRLSVDLMHCVVGIGRLTIIFHKSTLYAIKAIDLYLFFPYIISRLKRNVEFEM